jgi:metal-responsive CopG/Arc/MetJ family transcriptional regulator
MGRNHPAFADSERERASVHIQKSRLDDLDRLVDRTPGSGDSRSQQFRNAVKLWIHANKRLDSADIDLNDSESIEWVDIRGV